MTTTAPAPAGYRPEAQLAEVARGGALSLVGAAGAGLGGVALTVVVSRGLSPADAGSFLAVVALFGVVSAASSLGVDAGLGRFLLRLEASRRDADLRRLLRRALLPPVLLACLLAVVALLLARPLAAALGLGTQGAALVTVVLLALPLAVGTDLLLSGTRGLGRIRDTVVVDRIGRACLQPLAVLVALLAGAGLSTVGAAWAGVYVVSAVAAAVVLTRVVATRAPDPRHGQATDADLVRSFWTFTAPRGVAQLAQVVVAKADIVVVAAMLTPTHAAVYAVATRFVVVAQLVNLALTQVLQPRFTAILVAGDAVTLHAVFRAGTTWAIVLVWPVLLLVACLPQAYLGLFGAGYRTDEAVVVVWLMALAAMAAVACGPVDTLLLMAGRSTRSMTITLVTVAVDLAGLVLLVPRWGIAGAAVAWAVAMVVRSGLTVVSVRPHLREAAPDGPPAWLVGALPVAAALPLLLVGPADVVSPRWTVSAVVLSGAAYAVGLFVLRRTLGLDVLGRALRPGRPTTTATGGRPFVRTVGRHLSEPARGRVKALAHAWGMLTASWRMTPEVVVVGAQRCGTTTLFRLLSEHPALLRPTLSKGTGYFDDHYDRGPRWYRSHFPLRRPGARLRTFEVSGFYLPHPLAARRIARDLPGVQVVVLVRDPVERARSAHEHERARGFEDLPLDVAVRAEGERTAGEVRRLQEDPGYRSAELRHHAYVQRGEYAHQIRRFTGELGAERVHVVDADRFFADPVREYVHLQESLGLPVVVPDRVEVANARQVRPVPDELRRSLHAHFAPHDADLEALLGETPSWRQEEDAT